MVQNDQDKIRIFTHPPERKFRSVVDLALVESNLLPPPQLLMKSFNLAVLFVAGEVAQQRRIQVGDLTVAITKSRNARVLGGR